MPGEHGFRFFPGFYKHVVDTMRRIPSFDGAKVADHLVPTTRLEFTQYDKPAFIVPAGFPLSPRDAGTMLRDILLALAPSASTPTIWRSSARASGRFYFMQGAPARRVRADELVDFVGAEERSAHYQKFLATGITRLLVAAKAHSQYAHHRRYLRAAGAHHPQSIGGSTDRVLDGPTNLVWMDPWLKHLESSGVQYVKNAEVEEIRARPDGSPASSLASKGSAPWCVGTTTLQRCPSRTLPPW